MAEKIIGAELILEDILVLQKYAENKIVVELGTFLGGGSYLLSFVRQDSALQGGYESNIMLVK